MPLTLYKKRDPYLTKVLYFDYQYILFVKIQVYVTGIHQTLAKDSKW